MTQDPSARAERWQAARQAGEEGRVEAALALVGPPPPAALPPAQALLVGQWLVRRPDPRGAIPYLDRAAGPDSAPATAQAAVLALVRLRLGFGERLVAVAHLRAALARGLLHPEMPFLLSRALQEAGWPDLALRAFAGIDSPGGWWRSVARDARRDMAAARQVAREGLRALRAGETDGLPDLARALMRAGRLRAAAGVLARAPETPERDWMRAVLALRLREGEADAGLRAALRPPAGASRTLLLRAAALLQSLGAQAEVLDLLAGLPDETLRGQEGVLLGRALLAAGRAAELEARAAARLAATPRRLEEARLLLSARLLQGGMTLWRQAEPAVAPPMKLVQYWNAEPPPDVLAAMDSWVRHHPRFEPVRFDDAGARAFLVARHGAAGGEAFDVCHNPALRANLLRISFLAAHGGLWVDADERCLRPMDEVLARLPGFGLIAVCSTELPYYIHNYMLAALPGSPLMRALDEAQMVELRRAARGRAKVENWVTNGPGLVTRIAMLRPAEIALIDTPYWRSFAQDADDLAYKRDAVSDWRFNPRGIAAPADAG